VILTPSCGIDKQADDGGERKTRYRNIH